MATQAERIARMEEKLDNLIVSVDEIKNGLDKRFAAKWVQTVVAGFVAAVLLGFTTVIVNYFIPRKTPSAATVTTTSSQPNGSGGSVPSATASATAKSDAANPSDSQTSTSSSPLGEVLNSLPKVNQ